MRTSIASLTVTSLLSFASLANAQQASHPASQQPASTAPGTFEDNILSLSDGTMVRGSLTSIVPDVSIDITLADGTSRHLLWGEIREALGPSFPGGFHAAQSQRAAPPPRSDYPTATNRVPTLEGPSTHADAEIHSPGPGRVPVSFVASERVFIGRPLATGPEAAAYAIHFGTLSRPLCITPCMLYVEPGEFEFTTTQAGLRTLTQQVVVSPTGSLVELSAPSRARRVAPTVLWITGAVLLAGAVAIVGIGLGASSGHPSDAVIGSGIGMTVGAGASLVTGTVLDMSMGDHVASTRPLAASVSIAPTAQYDGASFSLSAAF